jgi:hypothetical protein
MTDHAGTLRRAAQSGRPARSLGNSVLSSCPPDSAFGNSNRRRDMEKRIDETNREPKADIPDRHVRTPGEGWRP